VNPAHPEADHSKRKAFLKALSQLEEVENNEETKSFSSSACAASKMSETAQSPEMKNLLVDSDDLIEVTILEDNDIYQVQNRVVVYPVACPKCSTDLTDFEFLKSHMVGHWTQNNLCPICDLKIVFHLGNFLQHLNSHLKKKAFVCTICKKSSHKRFLILSHIKRHRKRLLF